MGFLARATWATERMLFAASRMVSEVARARRASGVRVQPFAPIVATTWTVPEVLSAIERHEEGDFSESALLVRSFGRDDRISAVRGTRIRALSGRNGAGFALNPSEDGHRSRRKPIVKRVEKWWTSSVTETALWGLLEPLIDLGVSIARIHWGRVGREWRPIRIQPWPMEYVRWDELRGCYMAMTKDQGEVEVRPGTGEWIVIEGGGTFGYLAGAVRAMGLPFLYRSFTWKDWVRYCEKHGVPILAIEEPTSSSNGKDQANKDTFYKRLKTLGREGIIRLPRWDDKNKYDAKMIEPRALSWPAFQNLLVRLETSIAIYYLGQNLSTEVTGGSYAAALAQDRVRLDYLAADAEALSTALREQLLMPWGRFNFDWWEDALAPWPTWSTSAPEDLKAKADTHDKAATALTKLRTGLKENEIDEVAYCETYGIPIKKKTNPTPENEPPEEEAEPTEDEETEDDDLAWLDEAA